MANLSIRKLDKKAYDLLRTRAAKHGLSMEEEARQMIYQAVAAPEKMSALFKKYFGPENGIDLKLEKRKPHEPLDLNE